MPKNTTGGKKHKKGKRSRGPKETPFREDDENYAIVVSECGDRRFRCRIIPYPDQKLEDNVDYDNILGLLRNLLKSRGGRDWSVKPGCLVLLSIREYEKEKADILYRYSDQEVMFLKRKGEIPEENTKGKNSVIIFKKAEIDEAEAKRKKAEAKRLETNSKPYMDMELMPPSDGEEEEEDEYGD